MCVLVVLLLYHSIPLANNIICAICILYIPVSPRYAYNPKKTIYVWIAQFTNILGVWWVWQKSYNENIQLIFENK